MVDKELLKKYGFDEEIYELLDQQFLSTGFPKSIKRYNLVYEVTDLNIEEPYFWVLDHLKNSYPKILKIEDSFSASENSAFFGVSQQRLGVQQDKIGQYLATIGKMVKELFQMVRELRILKERLTYYDGVEDQLEKDIEKRRKSDDITLKGIFIDLIQGGGKNPASVYGMAANLEFVTLPDLFFDAPPFRGKEEMETFVDGLRETFNESVIRVLRRHLNNFMVWRIRTHSEHKTREDFLLKYLKQHYDIIQMYITWIKPYLKTVKRLSLKGAHQDSADLISSFEGSMMDIEIIAYDPAKTHCVMVTFNYRTRPHMKFQQEGYQRGPVHVGKMDMQVRAFDWNEKKIMKYKEMKEEETLELIGDMSKSVQESMNALGDELKKYLEESKARIGESKDKVKKEEKVVKKTMMQTLFGDFYTPNESSNSSKVVEKELDDGMMGALTHAWLTYHLFKKAHRMITW